VGAGHVRQSEITFSREIPMVLAASVIEKYLDIIQLHSNSIYQSLFYLDSLTVRLKQIAQAQS